MNSQRFLAARRNRRLCLLQNLSFAVLAAGAMVSAPGTRAATDIFIGNGPGVAGAPVFSTGFNPTPQNGDTLVFGTPGLGGTTVTDDIASLTVGGANTDGIDFTAGAPGYTINASGGAVLTLGSSGTGIGINDLSINAQTINVPLTLASSQTLNVANRAGSLTLSGVISDGGSGFGLTKTGNGVLTLSGLNTFTGGVSVTGGVLAIAADGTGAAQQLGSGAVASNLVLDGGTLRLTANTTTAAPTISANRAIKLGNATAGTGGTVDVVNGVAYGFNGVMSDNGGANSFTKTGLGIFTLGGANTYTGNTQVNQGTLALDFNQTGAPASNIINAGSALVMGGNSTTVGRFINNPLLPVLNVSGSLTANTNVSQSFNGLTLNQGSSSIRTTQPTATSGVLLNLGAITRTAGGSVNFSLAGAASATNAITTSNVNDASGILGGWATYNGADYATVGANGITAYTGYTTVAAGGTIADSGAGTPTNVNLTNGTTTAGTFTLGAATNGATNVNTIRQGSATAAATIDIGTGKVLRLGVNGGILQGSQVSNLGSTSLTIGTGTGAGGGILTAGGNTLGTAGEITINQVVAINNTIQINSVIANNNATDPFTNPAGNSTGGGAVTLTINSPGQGNNGTAAVRLTGANTYSGGTYINGGGRVETGSNTAFGTGNVYILQGGQVFTNNTFANNFFVAGGASDTGEALRGGTYNGVITLMGDARIGDGARYNNQITGGYNISFDRGTSTLANTTANANNWTGNTLLEGGLNLGASDQIPDGAAAGNLNIGGNTFDLQGFSERINGLTGTATLGQGTVQNSAAGASVFTVGGNNQSFTYNGALKNSTGTLALVKAGAGLGILGNNTTSNQSNYAGGTTVNNGTLRFATAGMTGTPLGSVNGLLTVNGGATFGGTLDLNGNNLTMGGLSGAAGTVSGLITSTGTGTLTLTVNNNTGTGGGGATTTYAGTLQNGSATSLGLTLPATNTGTLDLSGTKTYTGPTNVAGGKLQIGVSPISSGSVTTLSGTGGLVLGDSTGTVAQTFNNLSTASSSTITGGNAANSTLTLNGAATGTYANVFGGAGTNQNNLNLVIAGTGPTPATLLTGTSTYTGTTTVNGGSTLVLSGGSIGGSALTLNTGATLTGSGNNSTTAVVGSLTAAGGSAITLSGAGGTALRSTGAISLGGTGVYGAGVYATLNYTLAGANTVEALNTPTVLTLNSGGVYVNVTNPTIAGTYTLANFGSLTGPGSFSLSSTTANVTTFSVGRNTETLTQPNGTSLVLTIAGTPTPGVAFFNGAVSSVFNDATTSATLVNFSTDQAGATDAGNTPGSNTDVVLVANNATDLTHRNTTNIVTTLGASTTINSLNAIDATSSGLTRFTINADGSTLTINGNADSNMDAGGSFSGNAAGNAIHLSAGAAPLTINAPIIVGGGNNLTFTNDSANDLTLGSSVTGSAGAGNAQILTLSNTGSGGTTINGVIANSAAGTLALVVNNPGTGVTTLGATNTYSGGTTLNAGTLNATAAGGLGTGNVTVDANDLSFSNATLNTNGSIAATAAVTVNTNTGVGTINFNGATPTIGSLSGNGFVVLNNPGGTTLTIGSTNNLSSDFSGPISGTGNLITAGAGTAVLSGMNTYSGTTTVSGGILRLGSATALPTNTLNGGANLAINTGGTLDLNSNSTTLAAIPTGTGGTITDSSSTTSTLTLGGGGTLAQTLTGNLKLAVTSGNLTLNNTNSYTGGTAISGVGTTVTASTITGLGANAQGNAVSIGNSTSLAFTVSGSTTINDTFSGGGVLKINFDPNGGDTNANNFTNFTGTVELSATTTTGNKLIVGPQGMSLSGATLQIDNNAQVFAVNGNATFARISIIGTGNLEGRGAIRLTNSTLGGNITLAGSATIGNEGGTLTGNISSGVAGTQTLTMGTANSQGSALLSGNLSDGSGQFALTQAFGTTTLTGAANTYTGATNVTGGTLLVNGNNSAATGAVTVGGAPGGAVPVSGVLGGTGSVGGATTIGATGTITGATVGTIGMLSLTSGLTINGIYLADLTTGTNVSDRLLLTGTGANGLLTLGSGSTLTLSTTTLDGITQYNLANYASISGTFTATNVPTNYTLVYRATELDLVPTSTQIPEPSTWVASVLGFGLLGFSLRRRLGGKGSLRAA